MVLVNTTMHGQCGGTCDADADADGDQDDVDPCMEQSTHAGVQWSRAVTIGCTEIPDGDCDCNGNVLDECASVLVSASQKMIATAMVFSSMPSENEVLAGRRRHGRHLGRC